MKKFQRLSYEKIFPFSAERKILIKKIYLTFIQCNLGYTVQLMLKIVLQLSKYSFSLTLLENLTGGDNA